jgi:hypothetical protein
MVVDPILAAVLREGLLWPSALPHACSAEPTDADLQAHFNSGIETAASHVERMGLKLVARELRDLRRS